MGKSSKVTNVYKVGDLIFAKIKGSPYWPARIGDTAKELLAKNKFNIKFYGTHDTYLAKAELLIPYNDETKITHGQPKRLKSFNDGLWEIENNPDLLKLQQESESSDDEAEDAKTTSSGKSRANSSPEGSETSRKSNQKPKQKGQKINPKTAVKSKAKIKEEPSNEKTKKASDDAKRSTRRSGRNIAMSDQASNQSPTNSDSKEEEPLNESPEPPKTPTENSEDSKSSEAGSNDTASRRKSSRSKQSIKSEGSISTPRNMRTKKTLNKLAGVFENEATTSSSDSLTASNEVKSDLSSQPLKTDFKDIIKKDSTGSENNSKQIETEQKSLDVSKETTETDEVSMEIDKPEAISDTVKLMKQVISDQSADEKNSHTKKDKSDTKETEIKNETIPDEISVKLEDDNNKAEEKKSCLNDENKNDQKNEFESKKSEMTPEERTELKIAMKEKKTLEKKKAYVKSIQIQNALVLMDVQIRISLKKDNIDVELCCMIMEDMLKLPFSKKHLFNSPEIVDTIKKCRKFTQSEKVKKKATECFEKFRYMFSMGESFNTIFEREREKFLSENVEELKKERAIAAQVAQLILKKKMKESEPSEKQKTNRSDSIDSKNDKKQKSNTSKNSMDTS